MVHFYPLTRTYIVIGYVCRIQGCTVNKMANSKLSRCFAMLDLPSGQSANLHFCTILFSGIYKGKYLWFRNVEYFMMHWEEPQSHSQSNRGSYSKSKRQQIQSYLKKEWHIVWHGYTYHYDKPSEFIRQRCWIIPEVCHDKWHSSCHTIVQPYWSVMT